MKQKRITLVVVLALILFAIIVISQNTPQGEFNRETVNVAPTSERVAFKSASLKPAIELDSPNGFLNSEPFTLLEHIGKKVILIDFWTYSCINCQRTLPYLNSWWEKYEDDGLLIVGIHSPEFEFEKDPENVARAIEKFGVEYPVVQDNEFRTWRAYGNRYWPRKYLIDIDGFIVYDHIGEGSYEETESRIQEALEERRQVLGIAEGEAEELSSGIAAAPDFRSIRTPELYFGYKFDRGHLGNAEGRAPEQVVGYALPEGRAEKKFYLEGEWFNGKDGMTLQSETGRILLEYEAKNVNIVAGSSGALDITVLLDGEPSTHTINGDNLYQIVTGDSYEKHNLEIIAPEGFTIYTFTFG